MLDITEKFKVLNLQSSTTVTVDVSSTPVSVEAFEEGIQAILSLGAVTGAGSMVINLQSSTTSAGVYTTRGTSGSITSASANKIATVPFVIPAKDTYVRVNFDVTGTLSTVASATALAKVQVATSGINSTTFA
jgi:hypothetical protein